MQGLRSALAGLAETSEMLTKVDAINENTPKIDIAFLLANTESQIEKYAAMYKNLQPKEESLSECHVVVRLEMCFNSKISRFYSAKLRALARNQKPR
jgi:hypothetical protein